jgi:alpha-tubulin suppressor-like RCC1 family protein
LASQPTASLIDACNNVLSEDTSPVTLAAYDDASCSVASNPGTLGAATPTVAAASGASPFSGVVLNSSGTYYLGASASGYQSACTQVVVSLPSPATSIAFQSAGSASTASCIPLASSPVVKVMNSIGGVDTSSDIAITLEAFSDSGCTLPTLSTLNADSLTVTTNLGYANFSNVKLTGALENVYFRARNADGTLQTSCTGPHAVTRGNALLAFTTGPSATASAGIFLGAQPHVSFLDECLNPIINETRSVQLELYDNPTCTTPSTPGTMSVGSTTASPTLGVASFSDVKIFKAGVRYLGASATAYPSACTSVTVSSQAAYRIAVSTTGSNSGTAGINLAQVPIFEIQDAYANRITGSSATITLASFSDSACSVAYGGTLAPGSVTAAAGLATPASVSQTKSGTLYIKGTSAGLQAVCHGPITLEPGTATKLIYVTQPSLTANPAKNFTTQPVIAVADANNNVVPTAVPVNITLAAMNNVACSTSAASALTVPANPTATNASGVATFTGVQYPGTIANLRIRATAPGLTQACSNANTNVAAGAPTQLVFSQPLSPQSQTAGTAFTTQPTVEARDDDGFLANSFIGNVTLKAYTDSGCTVAGAPDLAGTLTMAATAGVASFGGISYVKASTIYIKATATGLTSACSPAHTITAGAASQLAFTTQPSSSGVAGNPLINQPIVEVQDSLGNRITSSSDTITLSAHTDSLCTLASTHLLAAAQLSVPAVNGVATFTEVTHSKAESLYIKAATGALSKCAALSVIAAGPASRLVFATAPTTTATEICTAFATQPIVQIQDAFGNTVTSATDSITLSPASDATCTTPAPGASSVNATVNPKNAASGVATFAGVSINLRGLTSASGTAYIKATSGALEAACTPALNLTANTTALAFTAQPASGTAGTPLTGNAQVEVRDSCNQKVEFGTYQVAISLTSDASCYTRPPHSLTATSTAVWSVGQVSTFSNITIPVSGGQYLRATRTGSTQACSPVITINPASATKLTVLTHPIQNAISAPLAPTISVGITDPLGNLVTGVSDTVTLSAYTDSGCTTPVADPSVIAGASLSGPTADSILHFPGLTISKEGTYYFKASSSQYGTTCTSAVDIHAAGQISGTSNSSVCHLTGGGAILCWGLSGSESRHGMPHSAALPQRLRGSKAAWKLASGTSTNCWVLTSGQVECIGSGTYGELGNDTIVTSVVPVRVKEGAAGPDLSTVIDLAGGGINGTTGALFCAVKAGGTVWCWGGSTLANGYTSGGLGDGSSGNSSFAVQVTGITDALSVTVGDRFACALKRTGTVSCWGRNAYGNLGDTTTTQQTTPVNVLGFDRVNLVAAQRQSLCALRNGGDLWCWGQGSQGGLAAGTDNDFYSPRTTGFPSKFRTLSGNLYKSYMCGALADGTVRCWGANNDRMIGNSNLETNIYVPTEPFPGALTNIRTLGSTTFTAYAAAADGTVYSWGRSGSNTVGIGATGILSRPTDHTALSTETGIVQLSVAPSSGGKHLCLRTADHILKCTGGDQYAPVGVGNAGPPKMALQTILSDAIHVSTSSNSTCAVHADGTVSCWGMNNTTAAPGADGLLGVGSAAEFTSTPSRVTINNLPADGLVEVAQTDRATCVRRNNGTIWCWGENRGAELGSNAFGIVTTFDSANAYQIPEILNAIKIVGNSASEASGLRSSFCALLATGEIHCWGDNIYGGLGRNTTQGLVSEPTPVPAAVAGISDAVDIKAGSGFYCARLSSLAGGATGSNLKCWGAGTLGQLGNAASAHSSNPVSVNLSGASAIDFALTFRVGCAIIGPSGPTSTVKCWGEHNGGATGAGFVTPNGSSSTPTLVAGVSSMEEIFGVGEGFLTRDASNHWYGWGKNYPNQLFLNEGSYSSFSPWNVQLPQRLAAGANHTCRVRQDGKVECWGSNSNGQLGIGSSPSRSESPVVVTGISNAYTIAAGGNHTCVAVADGNVHCWGSDGVGINSSTPMPVTWNGTGVDAQLQASRLAAGENHTCLTYGWGGATPGIRGRCWGLNASGQLGTNNTTSLAAPTTDLNITSITYLLESLALGKDHSCLQVRTGGLRCFGNNSLYQLNNANTTNVSNQINPTFYRPLSSIAAGGYHTCGVLADFTGRIGCMGDNTQGQLGDSTTNGSSAVKTFAYTLGISTADFGTLAAGLNHTCTGLLDGTVNCWGLGNEGQLGQGNGSNSLMPVATSVLSGKVREITAGEAHTCVRTSAGIQCFGRGTDGQLGNGGTGSSNSPVTVNISIR